jgi:hypothetical protein
MKLREAQDIILSVLYFCREIGNTGFLGLSIIFSKIKYNYNQEILFETGKYFEAKGYVQLLNSIDDVYVQIATQGIFYVEELIDTTGVNIDYVKEIAKALGENAISKSDMESPRKIMIRRKNVFKILDNIKGQIGDAMDPESYDMRIDIDIVKLELKKVCPDQEVIKMKLYKFDNSNKYIHEFSKISNQLNLFY